MPVSVSGLVKLITVAITLQCNWENNTSEVVLTISREGSKSSHQNKNDTYFVTLLCSTYYIYVINFILPLQTILNNRIFEISYLNDFLQDVFGDVLVQVF